MGRVTPTRVLATLLLAGSGLVVLTSLAVAVGVLLTDHGNSSDLDWRSWEPLTYILSAPWLLVATALVGAVVLGIGQGVARLAQSIGRRAGRDVLPFERDGSTRNRTL